MSRGTIWCIVITGSGADLIYAFKLAKNFKKFEKIFFALKNTFKSSQHKKSQKNFFGQIGLQFFAFYDLD